MTKKFSALMVAVAFVLTACTAASDGNTSEKLDSANRRIAELEAEKAENSPARGSSEPSTNEPKPESTAAPTTEATKPAATEALMPNVVCMNLQEAQDFIQSETGVFLSLSEDATGQGRMQIVDSNWIVVSQTPSPGTPIDEGDAVLSAVKLNEPNDC